MRLEIANWKNSKISEIYNFSKFSNVRFNLSSYAFNPISREVFFTPIFYSIVVMTTQLGYSQFPQVETDCTISPRTCSLTMVNTAPSTSPLMMTSFAPPSVTTAEVEPSTTMLGAAPWLRQ